MGAGLLALIGLTLMQVTLRYVFHHSLDWVEEISVFVMTWLPWAGAALLWLHRRHPAVDIAARALSPRARDQLQRVFDDVADGLAAQPAGIARKSHGTITGTE